MLQAIRSRAASFFVKALFAVLILTFVVWGIGDVFRSRSTETVVASVGNQEITAQELQNALQPALERLSAQLGQPFDLKQAKKFGIVDTVLRQLVDRDLANRETERLRLDVSDDVIRGAIYGDPRFRTANGNFNRALFNQALAQNNLTEAQFVELLRRDIPRADLYRAVTAGAAAPEPLLNLIYRFQNEKRVATILALPTAKAAGVGEPSAAALEQFYKAHPDDFRAPEYRSFTVASLVPDDIAKTITIPDDKLREAYQESQDEFVIPARRQVEQILAPSEAKAKAAEAALTAGKPFKEVATTIAGQDPATIDLGLVKFQDLPKPLADAAFSLPVGKPSQPIKSPLGWHILMVTKIAPPTTESFAEAKPKLAAEMAKSAAADRIAKIGDHVDDALAGGAALAATAKKFGLKTSESTADEHGMAPAGKPVSLPIAPNRVLKIAFSTDAGQTSRVYHTDDGGIFVVRTDKVTPPHVRPLADVKKEAIAAWQTEQRQKKIDDETAALMQAVKNGTPLEQAAAQKGLTATTSPPLLRQAERDPGVPPALVAKLFTVKPGAAVTIKDASGAYVAQLDKIEAPEAPKPADLTALKDQADTELQADLAAEFTASLRRQYPVTIYRDTLNKLF
ncbi:MAG TPA: peptidyl-prolyl cis-trans isomerase [Stellaceae bacterium]|nr:peptidyl-prolyl cis-trans isomerase [Stellaceae bacterium]